MRLEIGDEAVTVGVAADSLLLVEDDRVDGAATFSRAVAPVDEAKRRFLVRQGDIEPDEAGGCKTGQGSGKRGWGDFQGHVDAVNAVARQPVIVQPRRARVFDRITNHAGKPGAACNLIHATKEHVVDVTGKPGTAREDTEMGVSALWSQGDYHAVVIGAGPAGLMAAEQLVGAGLSVTIIEQMPTPARKMLLAGRGGLNITYAEPLEIMLSKYGAAAARLRPALTAFPPDTLRQWCADLGEPCFVGSSRRVFPASFKATRLLRAWLSRLDAAGVTLRTRCRWLGWAGEALRIETPEGEMLLHPQVVVLALGGGSWPRLGSDGRWTEAVSKAGIAVRPLKPANCGLRIPWSALFRDRFSGLPLKRIAITHQDQTVLGEALIDADGLEGGAVYALSAAVRDECARVGATRITIDFRPNLSIATLTSVLADCGSSASLANRLRRAGLSSVAAGLVRELRDLPADPAALAVRIKAATYVVTGVQGLARAISSAGGLAFEELDDTLMIRCRPGVFVAGEMLDWEASTGGYLLQASLSTGHYAGGSAIAWIAAGGAEPH